MPLFKADSVLFAEGAGPCPKTGTCRRPAGHSGKCSNPDGAKPKADKAPAGMGSVTSIKGRVSNLEKRLDGFIGGIGALVYPFDQICGGAVIEQSGDLSAALDALARENPKVKQTLERMLAGGAWSGVVLAAAPIVFAIAGHHVLPLFGKQMPSSPAPLPPQAAQDPHRPIPPGQHARQEEGWNEVFTPTTPEEVFGYPGA